MNSLKTRFSEYIKEQREVKMTRDNKFKVVVETSDEVIDKMEMYNVPKIGSNNSGEWLIFDMLHKNYSFTNNEEGEVIEDQNGALFFAMNDDEDACYKLVDENRLQRLLEGL